MDETEQQKKKKNEITIPLTTTESELHKQYKVLIKLKKSAVKIGSKKKIDSILSNNVIRNNEVHEKRAINGRTGWCDNTQTEAKKNRTQQLVLAKLKRIQ